ncbi:hypothetical protein [Neptunicella sp. SCSIO 80796]|uniref:hypothetical protein n=1 Tax=Neptunicella plasticusilytica TaxID=3117012 RepID=UPI003A4DD0EE
MQLPEDIKKWLTQEAYVSDVDYSQIPELEEYHPTAYSMPVPEAHRQKTNVVFTTDKDWHVKVILNGNIGEKWPEIAVKILDHAEFIVGSRDKLHSQRIAIRDVLNGNTLRGWTHVTIFISYSLDSQGRSYQSELFWEKHVGPKSDNIVSGNTSYTWRE